MHISIREDEDFELFESKRLKHHFSTTTSAIRFAMHLFTQNVDALMNQNIVESKEDERSDS